MSELTWGGLGRTVIAGILPEELTVQVIGSKSIGGPAPTGGEHKFRVVLWDGHQLYKNGLLATELTSPPTDYSIIRVGSNVVAPGRRQPVLKQIVQKGETNFALVFDHYDVVRDGSVVKVRLQQPSSPSTASSADLLSPASTQGASPVGGGTPAQPPALLRPPEHPPRSNQPAVVQPAGREAVKRNLDAAAFPDGPSKRPAASQPSQAQAGRAASNGVGGGGGAEATHQVAALNPYINKYVIKVRVSKKSAVKQIATSRWSGSVADCLLSDSSGDIKLTGFESQASSLDSLLEAGSTYTVSGAKIQPVRNPAYNTTGHQYELVWTQYTQVSGPLQSSPVAVNYKLVPISEISCLEKNQTCDVCAWVQDLGTYVEFRSRADKDLKKREILLTDDSEGGSSIRLTLWGDQAKNFSAIHQVLAVKGATVGEFNGVKNLSLGFSGSLEVEPAGVERVQQLVAWSHHLQDSSFSQLSASQLPRTFPSDDFLTVEDLRREVAAGCSGGEVRARISGYILQIMEDTLAYRAHVPPDGTRCQRKVVESREENRWTCQKCNKRDIPECDTTLRYNLRLCIADATSATWCNMFDATSLFQKSPQELVDLKDQNYDQFKKLLSSLTMVSLIFRVSAKMETFNDSSKLKVVVQDVSRITWEGGEEKKEAVAAGLTCSAQELVRWQVAQVHSLEAELGVAHDQEYGITWDQELEL